MKAASGPCKRVRAKEPIKHSKTFSGCWTCRDRHVKCDETHPQCVRCRKGGFDCQGYGIKLVWLNPDTQEREQNIRRAIGLPATYDADSRFMRVDVHEVLETIDKVPPNGRDFCAGPFSVFAVGGYPHVATGGRDGLDSASPSSQDTGSLDPLTTNSTFADESDDEDDVETIVSPFVLAQTQPNSPRGLFATPPDTLSAPEWHIHPQVSRHLDLLPRPVEQRELINHWTSFVCRHLVPVDRADNPFRSVFTPMALAGLNSPSNESNGQIALFHALCATSAFSRSQLLNYDARTSTLAMKHYNLAIMHLRHSLADLDGDLQQDISRGSILATITMFSAMDMITGRSSEWRTHLEGGASWLSTIESAVWARDKSSSMVYQGYLAIAALCNISLPSTIDVESDLDERNYVLDRFFGLTRPILKHIVVMNTLIKQTADSYAHIDPDVLDQLEMQLYMQTPANLELDGLDPRTQQLTRHHAFVFYYASLIYFQRTVRRSPPEAVQELVACAVGHFEDIEDLGGDAIGCTLVWPPFVVASECLTADLQHRMLAWYKLKRRHGFMNLEISKDIAQEVWRRRSVAEPGADIRWQDVLKDLNMDIVLA